MDDARQIMHERSWELRKDRSLTLEQLEKQKAQKISATGLLSGWRSSAV